MYLNKENCWKHFPVFENFDYPDKLATLGPNLLCVFHQSEKLKILQFSGVNFRSETHHIEINSEGNFLNIADGKLLVFWENSGNEVTFWCFVEHTNSYTELYSLQIKREGKAVLE